MLLALFTGGAAGSSSVLLAHWVSFAVTLPLASLSAYFVVRTAGLFSALGLAAMVGSLLVMANPVYNLLVDSNVVKEVLVVSVAVNAGTWLGIGLSTVASVLNSNILTKLLHWWNPNATSAPVCER